MQTCRVYVLNKSDQLKIYATVQVPIGLELSLSAELTSLSSQSSHKIPLNNELSSNDQTKFLALQAGVIQFARKFSSKGIQNSNVTSLDASSILRSVSRVEKQEKQQVMQKREKASFDESSIIRSLNSEEKEEKQQKIQQRKPQMSDEQKVQAKSNYVNPFEERITKNRKSSCLTQLEKHKVLRHSFQEDESVNENNQKDQIKNQKIPQNKYVIIEPQQTNKQQKNPSGLSAEEIMKEQEEKQQEKQQEEQISELSSLFIEEKQRKLRRQIIEELPDEDGMDGSEDSNYQEDGQDSMIDFDNEEYQEDSFQYYDEYEDY